ncbi:AbfB domain-containing protein [Thermoactinospora rubra]|uniref:AbfB domain-containing protein n=1 Tax=Thermoactinospora rubra TaxID=1088767 RepID=UPI000A100F45
MLPGLAESTGVSLESVNVPGSLLRHHIGAIRLDADDGSPRIRADTTRYRVPGPLAAGGRRRRPPTRSAPAAPGATWCGSTR